MIDTQKQRILQLRCAGKSYAAIADALGISENTVKSFCRRNSVEKMKQCAAEDVCAQLWQPIGARAGGEA